MKKIKSFLYLLWKIHYRFYRSIFKGTLKDIGFVNTVRFKKPYDKDMNPIPTYSYAALKFIQDKLQPSMDILEFGAGHSSLYYATKVNTVTSIEHDLSWFRYLNKVKPSNLTLIHRYLHDNYESVFNKENTYDIIIVDGRKRVKCMLNCHTALKENGVIILDDAQREEYKEGIDFLLNLGFKKIDFYSQPLGDFTIVNTIIFYKTNNCFKI